MARISLLQLDTRFPRIPGDVGCPETFTSELEIIRVPNATVEKIVTDTPSKIDLSPFLKAIETATGDIITTSCGFLAPFQKELQAVVDRPVIASALEQLSDAAKRYSPAEVSILTFDADRLGIQHLPADAKGFAGRIYGLDPESHLRDVISNDRTQLDTNQAQQDVCSAFAHGTNPATQMVVLECTNLPPYKHAMRKMHTCEILDILTAIESVEANSINPRFL